MANRYDDETMKFIETRKRVAHMRREEAKRKRNIMIAIIAAVVILVVIIVIAATSCSCGGSKDEETTVAQTTVEETTVEETTEEEEETTAEDFAEGTKAYVTEDGVRLRSEASTDSDIVDELSKGTEVTIISNEDDWMKVKTDSEEGYINKDYLSTEKVSSDSSDDSDEGSDEETENSNDNNENTERTIETRRRTIDATTKSSGSGSNKKPKTNDKRTLY